MSDEPDATREGRPGPGHGSSWWAGVASTVLIYVLSPPPLAWLFDRMAWDTPDWPRYVYAPLILLYHQFEPVKTFYDGYSELLGVRL